jgi:hypothetical protein
VDGPGGAGRRRSLACPLDDEGHVHLVPLRMASAGTRVMRTPRSRAGTVTQTVLALVGMKAPTQSVNLSPLYVAGLHLYGGAVQNPCGWCGDLCDRAPAGLLTTSRWP